MERAISAATLRPAPSLARVKVEVALTELRGARLVIVFPHESYVRPGVGDDLINRVAPYVPPMGIMLIAEDPAPRAYARFETHELLPLLLAKPIRRFEIDLSNPPESDDDDDLPF